MFNRMRTEMYYYFRHPCFGGGRPEKEALDEAKACFLQYLQDLGVDMSDELLEAVDDLVDIADLSGFHLGARYINWLHQGYENERR